MAQGLEAGERVGKASSCPDVSPSDLSPSAQVKLWAQPIPREPASSHTGLACTHWADPVTLEGSLPLFSHLNKMEIVTVPSSVGYCEDELTVCVKRCVPTPGAW